MEKLRDRLYASLKYAIENDSFNKANVVRRAKNVGVFGLGKFFHDSFVDNLLNLNIKVDVLADNNPAKWGKEYFGLKVVPPCELKEYEDLIVIIMLGDPIPVEEQLDSLGIRWVTHADLIIDDLLGLTKDITEFEKTVPYYLEAFDLLNDEKSKEIFVEALCNRIAYPLADKTYKELYSEGEYFSVPVFPLSDKESFVDCGAYDGDTVKKFADIVGKYTHIWAYELDRKNFLDMEKNLEEYEKVTLCNAGVWDENGEIEYSSGNGTVDPLSGFSIKKAEVLRNVLKAKVVKLDDSLSNERVSFIKMDIEGAEVNALRGAENIIRKERPKLAVCIYHKTSDFWEVPLLINSFGKYKFYIRHHGKINCWDTICYAVPIEEEFE